MKKILATIMLLCCSSFAWSADYYYAQTEAGDADATSCANAMALSSLTWGAGNHGAAGNTIHLCGTFTGSANTTMLTIGASGESGSPITIKFEDDAVFTAPYWSANGAIVCSSKNYVTIDGGNNGVIENTANGTGLTYSVSSGGVVATLCSNLEIKNLTVRNMYVHTYAATDTSEITSSNISATRGSNISIHDNTLSHNMKGATYLNLSGSETSNVFIYDNVISNCNWGIGIGTYNTSTVIETVNIYGNDITVGANWFDASDNDYYHTNGIMIWGNPSVPSNVNNLSIYNNYIHSVTVSPGTLHATGWIYWTSTNGTGLKIFNNLFTSNASGQAPSGAYIRIGQSSSNPSPTSPLIVNNTIDGRSSENGGIGIGIKKTNGTPVIKNNIVINCVSALSFEGDGFVPDIDYNDYYNNGVMLSDYRWPDNLTFADTTAMDVYWSTHYSDLNSYTAECIVGSDTYVWIGSTNPASYDNTKWAVDDGNISVYTSPANLSSLRVLLGGCPGSGRECNTIDSSPSLDANYKPDAADDPVVGIGVNLTSLDITALNSDANSVIRPAEGAWDIGAYEYGAGTTQYALSITATNATVTSSPAGINCGATCTYDYDDGTEVTLSATCASGYQTPAYSGDCSTNTVTMTAAKSCTVSCSAIPVSNSGGMISGGGTVQ